ncbi:MAG: hypothetical protein GXO39_00005, partial [Thermotogae bacterium]|nr:hypothetical protein [Thermotogota bacterium]
NPRAARDIYRQIKLALDSQENYIDARKFYALELQAHGRELEGEIRREWVRLPSDVRRPIGRLVEGNLKVATYIVLALLLLVVLGLLVALHQLSIWGAYILVGPNGFVKNALFFLLLAAAVGGLVAFVRRYSTLQRVANAYQDLLVYYLYGDTANFGLSWVRPFTIFLITVMFYGAIYQLHSAGFPYNLLPSPLYDFFYSFSDALNSLARPIFPHFIASQFHNIRGLEFISLIFYVLSGYLVYQTIVGLRRRVRR